MTPFFPCQTPTTHLGRATSPVNIIRPGYEKSRTLPARFSPGGGGGGGELNAAYSTDFSSNRSEDLGSALGQRSPHPSQQQQQNIRVSSTYTQVRK